jgi:hypothetical protein
MTPDPLCPICFGRGRYDDDGDRWIECVCMPDLKNLDDSGVGGDTQTENEHGRRRLVNDEGLASSVRLVQFQPIIHSNFREPQSNLVSLDERKTKETVN